MTTIKPPIGPFTTVPHTTDAASGLGSLETTRGAVPSGGVSSPHVGQAGQAGQTGSAQPVGLVDLARAVETGQLSMSQAVERLVEQTLGNLPGPLTELERLELTQLLQNAVAQDPTLRALRDEQG